MHTPTCANRQNTSFHITLFCQWKMCPVKLKDWLTALLTAHSLNDAACIVFHRAHVWVCSGNEWILVGIWNPHSKPSSKCPLYIHPGAETQARGMNYHTETVLVIIDWRNARHSLMNMETLHCASPNGFSELMAVWEKWARIRLGR